LYLSLREGKTIAVNEEVERTISSMRENSYGALIQASFERTRYGLLIRLLDYRSLDNILIKWFRFLACSVENLAADARETLDSIEFNELIDAKKHNPLFSGFEENPFQLSHVDYGRIDILFPPRFPYHRISFENFVLLLKKTSDPCMSLPIDWAVKAVKEEAERHPEHLHLNPEYGKEYDELMIKKHLLARLSNLLSRQDHKYAYASHCLRNRIYESILERYTEIMVKVKREERNRILANLSHSIKNMLRSVIDPLINLRNELPAKSQVIDNAIKGANLIREIVNAINLSFQTSMEDLLWDIAHPGTESISLQDIVTSSIHYSISNMFDFKYFPVFASNYFPQKLSKTAFQDIQDKWNSVTDKQVFENIAGFTNECMFTLTADLHQAAIQLIGNEKSSAIKLMILFQEIIFNAVKYASFVPLIDRYISITLEERNDRIRLEVRNSYRPEVIAKTTGIGQLVIENFAKVLDCVPEIKTTNTEYSISLEFENIWREHAKDTLH